MTPTPTPASESKPNLPSADTLSEVLQDSLPGEDFLDDAPDPNPLGNALTRRLARWVLASFLFTFILARILVIFIMMGKLPAGLFFHVSGTHVHHLNYGIFLLSATGGWLIFARPTGKMLVPAAVLYGIGLGLTFDEFGMWLHLGGAYWQRASYDAVITIASLLGLLAYGAQIRRLKPRHLVTAILLVIALGFFGYLLHKSWNWAGSEFGPKLEHLEQNGPT
jgi:hypothetical protein